MRMRCSDALSSSPRYALGLAAVLLVAATPATQPTSSDCQDYEGLLHCAVGGATLRPMDGALGVDIQADGGGVHIETPGRTSWGGKFTPVVLSQGASMTLTATGRLPDGSTEQVARISAANDPAYPGAKVVYLDMSASRSKTFSYRGYQQGQLVCEGHGIPAQSMLGHSQQALPVLGIVVAMYILDHVDAHVDYSQKDGWSGGLSWNKPAAIVIGPKKGDKCEADLLMFTPELQAYAARELEHVEVTGSKQDGFDILYEDVDCTSFSGLQHCPIGDSVVESSAQGLLVKSTSGKGSAVRVLAEGASSWDAWLAPIEPKDDSRMEMTFRGTRSDGSLEVLEQLAVARSKASGEGFNGAYVKPSLHGASTYTVRGYQGGKLVFERAKVAPVREEIGGPQEPGDEAWMRIVSFVGSWNSGHHIYNDGGCTPGFDFPFPTTGRLPDGMWFPAVDYVTVTADDVHPESVQFHDVSFKGVGMESFQLVKESSSP